MTQQEYADLIAGHLSPADLDRLTAMYGSDTITSILRGETLLRDVLTTVSDHRAPVDLPPITLDEQEGKPLATVLSRKTGWLVVLGAIIVVAGLAAVVPRVAEAVADTSVQLTDPLPLTILVILLIGLGAMFLMERSSDL